MSNNLPIIVTIPSSASKKHPVSTPSDVIGTSPKDCQANQDVSESVVGSVEMVLP